MEESADNNQRAGEEAQDIEEEGGGGDGTEESAGEGEIFEGLVHPLKVVKIKNPFGFLQSSPKILAEQVEPILFIKNMFP